MASGQREQPHAPSCQKASWLTATTGVGQCNLCHSSSHPQGLPPPPASASVTLAIHPLESPRNTGPPPAPIHPLSRRYQPPTQTSPSVMPPLRIEDYMATVDEPQPEELERTQQGNANEVRRASERERTSEVLANQTKENPHQAQHQAQSRPRDSNMSMAKAATEKLKWKFLGW